MPEYLSDIKSVFHYCSIETLQKILEYKTIRFRRFDLMDDQTEAYGLPEMIKKSYFLSCWVADQKEKIPQWAMYAPNGVRIELPLRWYKRHKIRIEGTDQFIDKLPTDGFGDPFFPFPLENWNNKGQKFVFMPPLDENEGFVVKVQYDDNFIHLKNEHWKAMDDGKGIGLTHSCAPVIFKDSYWSFQDEIRYYLIANYKYEDRNELPEYFDIPINESALKSLKIRLYPNCNDEDAKTVEKIIARNLMTQDSVDIIERSYLDGKYKPKK